MVGAVVLVAVCAAARPGLAQISSEEAPRSRTVPLQEDVRAQLDYSRYRLGPLRIQPFFTLRDVGYNNNLYGASASEETVGDWTATAAGGVKYLLPLGSKLVLRGTAAPEYTWYLDLAGRRGWGGTYDGELVGLFNRVTVEAGGGYRRANQLLSSEAEVANFQDQTFGKARLEIDVLRRLSIFGGADGVKTRIDQGVPILGSTQPNSYLNRTERAYRGGLRYRFREYFSIGAQVEKVRTEFVDEPIDRDNDSTGYLLVAHYDQPRFYVDLSGGYRESKALYEGSYFEPYQTGTYGYFVSYVLARPLELQVLGYRKPVPSFFVANSYYFETRNGAALSFTVGTRTRISISGSLGSNSYPSDVIYTPTNEVIKRKDDVRDLSGGIGVRLTSTLGITGVVTQSRYTSNIPGYDRSVVRFSFGLTWQRDFISIGAGGRS